MLIEQPEIVVKPWGYELIWANTPTYIGKILHVNEGQSLSLQYHKEKDETLFVLTGTVALYVEDEKYLLKEGQGYRILPGVKHKLVAIETSRVIEASTAHMNDVVRLQDDYGRV